ncbi:MAG: hypothetical protein WCD18_19345 [Thermosynechococcaceae cyanobacterium]
MAQVSENLAKNVTQFLRLENIPFGRSLQLEVRCNGQLMTVAVQPEPIPSRLSQGNP